MPTILIIDDEPAVLIYLKNILTGFGYDVRTASDSQSGCDEAKNHDIKLIISDLVMPGKISDMDLIRKLRALRPDCPVIVLSGYPTTDRLKETCDIGVEFLTKPFEIPFLAAVVKRLLQPDSEAGSMPAAPK